MPLPFQFVDNLDGAAGQSPVAESPAAESPVAQTQGVVEIPAGISTKPQLMSALERLLPLPGYFGGNWDALDECLRDRLTEADRRPLTLLHRDLPLAATSQDCVDYLALLFDTLKWAAESATCDFAVVFPTTVQMAVERLMVGYAES